MTPNEISTMSRAAAPHFGLWTPGECVQPRTVSDSTKTWCERCGWETKPTLGARPYSIPHEIPCPDLTQPEWAWRLLEVLLTKYQVRFHHNGSGVTLDPYLGWLFTGDGPPREAMLRAAYSLVQREAAK